MENYNEMGGVMGMSAETYKKYNREYMQSNPHNDPDIRRRRRRIVRSEWVTSIRTQ